MVYGIANKTIKLFLFTTNLLIFIFGGLLFSFSLWVRNKKKQENFLFLRQIWTEILLPIYMILLKKLKCIMNWWIKWRLLVKLKI